MTCIPWRDKKLKREKKKAGNHSRKIGCHLLDQEELIRWSLNRSSANFYPRMSHPSIHKSIPGCWKCIIRHGRGDTTGPPRPRSGALTWIEFCSRRSGRIKMQIWGVNAAFPVSRRIVWRRHLSWLFTVVTSRFFLSTSEIPRPLNPSFSLRGARPRHSFSCLH